MSSTVKDCSDYLHVLSKCNDVQRRGILKGADQKLVKAICECALNVVKGNIPLTPYHKRKLTPHKQTLRTLADKKRSLQSKKKIIVQKGGFLPLLLSAIVPTIASLLLK